MQVIRLPGSGQYQIRPPKVTSYCRLTDPDEPGSRIHRPGAGQSECSRTRSGSRHWELLGKTSRRGPNARGLVTDAVIIALCRGYGVHTVLSNDQDFHRFPSVKVLRQ
jgi:hypothetical protein